MAKGDRASRATAATRPDLQLSSIIASLLLAPYHTAYAWSFEKAAINWVKSSTLFADLHQQHVSSNQVRHMMKSTPLVNAPDEAKMEFANGPFGRMVAAMMESEQKLLGDWKLQKIVEAAGVDFDEDKAHEYLMDVIDRAPVTVFSFEDCPWCLLAEKLLEDEYSLRHGDGILQVVRLEELGREGKKLRAAVALSTGRTSMPACFIGNMSVGGYTDGFGSAVEDYVPNDVADMLDEDSGFKYVPSPENDLRCIGSPGLEKLHVRGELAVLLRDVQ
mmetsp:Transcript_31304/g.58047  ORF Transcript_31304/g.58047 Transcript_31304/m.58047 type:complete len:275 (-) Transcript_31304:450-1274(-)|eukprot:CAMPEP_0196139102 /NCGR_PEP_ID=MMETSP0910-20130528/6497_1 /TAXON_ID=49265 /ORGANISM="Thalassiosira rotula, Strain GSO102" /LENGTH=274 /DNA_ID=CAMNT_0041399787 /DNA_START=30 /DNA_END=854 /DNA_ORIENTATION=-